jgi:protocatechuate 3,4-dioxygenase alpha subunit
MSLRPTASQTVGPFFQIGLAWLYREELAGPDVAGERVTLQGRVLDGDAQPVPDALLEFWQADAEGRYPQPGASFAGFARVPTRPDGSFCLRTIKPGSVEGQAPHLNVHIFMRGLLRAVATRVYFPDEPSNGHDRVLSLVPPARRATLLARGGEAGALYWDVHMQGDAETVFFSY